MNVGIVSSHHYVEYSGTYNGMEFVVLFNSGGWRTAYVNVKNTFLENLDYMSCDEYLNVHGGFTYKENRLPFEQDFSENHSWLGWDYAHYGDAIDVTTLKKLFGNERYTIYEEYKLSSLYDGHIYTLLDVMCDCKKVIIQIKKGDTNEETNR